MRNNGVIKNYKSGTYRRKKRREISGRREIEKKNGRLDVARTFNRLYTPWCNYEIHFCRSRYVTCFDKDGKSKLILIRILLDLWEKNVHGMRIRSFVGRLTLEGWIPEGGRERKKYEKPRSRLIYRVTSDRRWKWSETLLSLLHRCILSVSPLVSSSRKR